MSDERLERITELARKAWPDVDTVSLKDDHALVEADGWARIEVHDYNDRAVDAIEGALRALAGEPSDDAMRLDGYSAMCAEQESRANAAEARLAELREMAGRWRDRSFHANAMHGTPPSVYDCASELLAALKETP